MATFTLLDIGSAAGEVGSTARQSFETSMVMDISALLGGVEADQVEVLDLEVLHPITVHIRTGSWGNRVSWSIDDDGQTFGPYIYGNHADYYEVMTLSPGEHTINCADQYGNGWYGGYWEILPGVVDAASASGLEPLAGGEDDGQVYGNDGPVVFSIASTPIPIERIPCNCGTDADEVCSDCGGLTAPIGGALGDCPIDGALAHYTQCLATCSADDEIMPMSCWDETLVAPASCCQAGTWWDGQDGSSCEPCVAGRYDHDMNPATTCVLCATGSYSDQVGASVCTSCTSLQEVSNKYLQVRSIYYLVE